MLNFCMISAAAFSESNLPPAAVAQIIIPLLLNSTHVA